VSGAITVNLNGEPAHLAAGTTVADLVAARCDSRRGIAVAVNDEVVPKSTWQVTTVGDGDSVEIVTAAAGG